MGASYMGLQDLLDFPREFAVFIGGKMHGEIECVGEWDTYMVAETEDVAWDFGSPTAYIPVSRTVYNRKKFSYYGKPISVMVADFVSLEAATQQLLDWFGGPVDQDYSLRTNPTPKWVTEGKGKDFI